MAFEILALLSVFYRISVVVLSANGVLRLRTARSRAGAPGTGGLGNRYLFLFPVYKEQKIIVDTCRHYEEFQKRFGIRLFFIGDGGETESPTTIGMVEDYFHGNDGVESLVLEGGGMKARKVNHCLSKIEESKIPYDYIFIFDCDSRIDIGEFERVDSFLSARRLDIASYIPVPVFGKAGSLLSLAGALNHLERIMAFELGSSLLPSSMVYPMGAAMCLSRNAIEKIGRIPEPIDDIPLGYLGTKFRLRKENLPFFVQSLPTVSAASFIRQHIPIFTGVYSLASQLGSYGFTLSIGDRLSINVSYAYFLLEFISLVLLPVAFFADRLAFSVLAATYLAVIGVSLGAFKMLTLRNAVLYAAGYYLRLAAFLNFLTRSLLVSVDLRKIKTERQ